MNHKIRNYSLMVALFFIAPVSLAQYEFELNKALSFWPASCSAPEMKRRYESKTFSFTGLHAVNGNIIKAYLKDQSTVVISGEAYGYTCERLSTNSSQYIWRPQALNQNGNVRVYIQSKFETYFEVSFLDAFSFTLEVPALQFFTQQDFQLAVRGKMPRQNRISLVFVAFDNNGNALPWASSYDFSFQIQDRGQEPSLPRP